MIERLLSSSRHTRREALESMPLHVEAAYAARDVLVSDSDGTVRARAAFFLARTDYAFVAPALRDALHDEMPLVRHAAVRGLALIGDHRALRRLERMANEDPIWWVRRAAIVSATTLGGAASIPMLREALDDPFWRVRHAAVRAFLSLDVEGIESLRDATSPRSAGALAYLKKRLGIDHADLSGPTETTNAVVALLDPDPAVVTARVERGDPVTIAFLVECLGDSHEALRVTARKRLAALPDARALTLALLWLEEPRVPHAAATVFRLLDGLAAEDVHPLLDHALSSGATGAACWALSYVAIVGDTTRLDHVFRLSRALDVRTRRAAIASLAAVADSRVVSCLKVALGDSDPDVVRLAAYGLLQSRDPEAAGVLASVSPNTDDELLRRVLVASAEDRGDVSALRLAMADEDAHVQATAVRALFARDALDDGERERLAADRDPWLRSAVLAASHAERVLSSDPQPALVRRAFTLVADRQVAASLASKSADSWLRARSAARLDPSTDLRSLLVLSLDSVAAVRAAAADTLERLTDLDARLDRFLLTEATAELRIAALAFRSRAFDAAALAHLTGMREAEGPSVRAWIDDVLSGFDESRPSVADVAEARPRPLPRGRELGKSGVTVTPLALSGVGNLPVFGFIEAMHAGCNLFFWEPRYHTLGRMLRSKRDAQIVTGTYHASERAIISDVERTLRRLRRETLDVFLLFWVRSSARVAADSFEVLSRLKQQGKIRAIGFSTHDRALACDALRAHAWDVLMTRHSAAHPGAEEAVLPLALSKGVGVLGFSALSYGRLLTRSIGAPDAYRYSLSQPGISTCISAPRSLDEMRQNLAVIGDPQLSVERQAELRAHGRVVRAESGDFAHTIRRHPISLADVSPKTALGEWLGHEESIDPRFG